MLPPCQWHIDIDRYINPYIPPTPQILSRGSLLRLCGVRDTSQRPIGNVLCGIWAFIGALASLSLIYVIGQHTFGFEDAGVPLTIGSFVS